ncbi:MAG: NAD(P)/FAD-dependent oxidoreductase, partial [Ignavibacteria bacterium]
MPHYNYLIIGGGMTADSAVKGIRSIDNNGSIGIIGKELNPPYNRPPLTKGLWKGKSVDKIWRGTDNQNAELHLGRTAQKLDPNNKSITDNLGNVYTFDKLLLATGGKTIKLPFAADNVIYYRTFEDYQHLRELTKSHNKFAVIGGGFIGSEIAAALSMNGKEVVMIFPSESIGSRIFPADLAKFINDYYKDKGVELYTDDSITDIKAVSDRIELTAKSGRKITADAVVGGIGIKPDTELAESANINTDNGIIVDQYLRTNYQHIFAAGDVANFYNPALDTRIRVEHEDNANKMGKHVGIVMAGELKPYNHLPFFYSDLFELGYEAVGDLDSRLETYSDWKEPFKEGVI